MAGQKKTPEERLATSLAASERYAVRKAKEAALAAAQEPKSETSSTKYDNWKYGDPVEADAPEEIRVLWWVEYKARQQAAQEIKTTNGALNG